ncbi:hypothetical protein PSCICN_10150 [Pseudomonas cichorii]|nr:hypothetical protein PSCICN_10150 [Pseudomonas cichorii]
MFLGFAKTVVVRNSLPHGTPQAFKPHFPKPYIHISDHKNYSPNDQYILNQNSESAHLIGPSSTYF